MPQTDQPVPGIDLLQNLFWIGNKKLMLPTLNNNQIIEGNSNYEPKLRYAPLF